MLTYAGAPETAGGPRGFQERVELSQTCPGPANSACGRTQPAPGPRVRSNPWRTAGWP